MPKSKIEKITEAQILGTRDCNLRCGYCRLVTEVPFKNSDELIFEEWKDTFKKLDSFGIKTVKGLGGEWTVKKYLPELVRYINDETGIKFALLSNSSFGEKLKNDLIDAGLNGYFASVDFIGAHDKNNKSGPGLEMLLELKDAGVENLGANTVMMRQNLKSLPATLEYFTGKEIAMNICPAHGGDNYNFEYRAKSGEMCLKEKDRPELEKTIAELLDMKDDGYLLACPSTYLSEILEHTIPLDWHCSEFSQLRIDANGDIKVCPDGGFLYNESENESKPTKKYNILEMTAKDYTELHDSWKLNGWRKNCPGCAPWSAQYRAEKNKKYGMGDPVLSGRKNR